MASLFQRVLQLEREQARMRVLIQRLTNEISGPNDEEDESEDEDEDSSFDGDVSDCFVIVSRSHPKCKGCAVYHNYLLKAIPKEKWEDDKEDAHRFTSLKKAQKILKGLVAPDKAHLRPQVVPYANVP